MSFLFGSAPKAVQLPPAPTTSGVQQNILQQLAGVLQQAVPQVTGTGIGSQIPNYPTQTVAPQTAGQQSIIDQLLNLSGNVPTSLPDWITSAASALPGQLGAAAGYQAPQVTAPQIGAAPQVGTPQIAGAPQVTAPQFGDTPQIGFSPDTPTIDASKAFQQGVAAPIIQDFQSQVIPSLNAGAGRSAGGIYSSDLAGATGQATTNLGRTLAQQGSLYDLSAQTANQQAKLTTNQLLEQIAQANQAAKLTTGTANQSANLTTALANQAAKLGVDTSNLGASLTTGGQNLQSSLDTILANLTAKQQTNQLNLGADLTGQQLDLSALGQIPGAVSTGVGTTYAPSTDATAALNAIFPTISTPQTTAETGLQQLIDEITKGSTFGQNLEGVASGLAVSPTIQNNAVAQGGSTGLLGPLLQGLGGNQGVTNAIGGGLTSLFNWISDQEAKEDLRRVGRLDRTKLPVYTYRYRGEDPAVRRIGVIAQDVEHVLPWAVGTAGPFKTVNYAEVALAEAFPLAEAA